MIKEFEVITDEKNKTGIDHYYIFKFKLNGNTYYSTYGVTQERTCITIALFYFKDLEFKSKPIVFPDSLCNEIKEIILKRKEIRLRHLVSPYTFE